MQLRQEEPSVWYFPSCEPGRFKQCTLDVVRWWKRSPRKGKPITVPAGLKLAILSRGRVRLPFNSIKWLIKLGRLTHNPHMLWAHRLPPDFELVTLLSGVDVTVELFVVLPALRTSTVNYILGRYLKQRHAAEVPNCKNLFLFTWAGANVKTALERKLSSGCPRRIGLDALFKKANVKMPVAMDSLERQAFILLVYASFPNDIELHLRPEPRSGGTPVDRMWGHLHRTYDELIVLDEEDEEVLCLIDKILSGANDEFTSRLVAEAYSEERSSNFRLHLKTALRKSVERWTGTDVKRFTQELRRLNRVAQSGLAQIHRLANDDISHSWPRVKKMWAWLNSKLKDSDAIMSCYAGKLEDAG